MIKEVDNTHKKTQNKKKHEKSRLLILNLKIY